MMIYHRGVNGHCESEYFIGKYEGLVTKKGRCHEQSICETR
jgi:hypothetical protein